LNWFGDRADDEDLTIFFSQFIMFGDLPEWADQFAQSVLDDLEAFSTFNLSPRTGKRPEISFSIVR